MARVIRTTETIDSKDGKRYVYRLIGNVHYDTFNGNGWIPQTREKDVMVFAWSGNNVIVNGSGTALMVSDTVNFWTHAYKNTNRNTMGDRFVSEYPIAGGWGVRFDLPNNSLVNGYVNFKLSGEVKVAALTDFNFYHEYAHRTIVGDVSVSIGSGGSINIGTGGTDVAKAKALGIILPV